MIHPRRRIGTNDAMYETILVPTDGSEAATRAGEFAAAMAGAMDARLHILYVLDFRDIPPALEGEATEQLRVHGEDAIDAISSRVDVRSLDVTTEISVTYDPIHETIIEYGEGVGADLIVMGRHGHDLLDRFAIGSVAKHTLRQAPMPVLTIDDDATLGDPIETICVATDGSDSALAAAERATALAAALGASLHVVTVVDTVGPWGDPGLTLMLETLEERGRMAIEAAEETATSVGIETVHSIVEHGAPASTILDYATDVDADIIVVGTAGRTGLDRLLLGSVAERIIRLATVPVIAVKAPDECV